MAESNAAITATRDGDRIRVRLVLDGGSACTLLMDIYEAGRLLSQLAIAIGTAASLGPVENPRAEKVEP